MNLMERKIQVEWIYEKYFAHYLENVCINDILQLH